MLNHTQSSSITNNLLELRQRILKSILATFVVFLLLLSFSNDIYQFIALPLCEQLPTGSTMIATGVASPFLAPFKLTLVVAFFISIPYWLNQLWGFIAPGLYINEKRIALPLLIASVALFYIGVVFAYFVVFPILFTFFTKAAPANVQIMTDINNYLNFTLKLFFAFGISFEIPIFIILCIISGLVTPQKLINMRAYVIIICFILGMLLTPPDVISQTLLALPMWGLFEIGLLIGRFLKKCNIKTKTTNNNMET